MTRGLILIRGLLTFAMLSGVVHQVTPSARADGGTSVGGGGDPLYFFLENSRSKLVLAVNKLIYEPDTRAYICNGARLTDEHPAPHCSFRGCSILSSAINTDLLSRPLPLTDIDVTSNALFFSQFT